MSLKTVGLFVLMTQAGILIPAKIGTEMAVFENVYADIGDEQSIEQSLSTFSSHMRNIVHILNHAGEGDLALFDELGAGTDPQEGASLAISILENLHSRRITTVATTHYSELKLFAINQPGVENASCEFDVETLKPTYKLLIGIPGKSNAFSISKKLGLSEEVLNRAKEFISAEEIKFEDVLSSLEKNLQEAEKERAEAGKLLAEAKRREEELSLQRERLKEKRDEILRKANETARKALTDAVFEVESLIKELKENDKKMSEQQRLSEARTLKGRVINRIRDLESSLAIQDAEEELFEEMEGNNTSDDLSSEGRTKSGGAQPSFKQGQQVLIKGLNIPAIVVSEPGKTGQVMVLAGSIKMNVHISELKPSKIKEKKENPSKAFIGSIAISKSRNIKTEIDFRGYTVDEAILELDKYLDDANLSGLKEVRIIHGKGTGALRQGIHEFLKRNQHVVSFRLGKYGEGEHGVTVVEVR